jgi:hypothetical protein
VTNSIVYDESVHSLVGEESKAKKLATGRVRLPNVVHAIGSYAVEINTLVT